MNLNDAKSVPVPRKRSFRVGRGRGSGWGKTSRRGQKGASSRAGWGGGIMREGGQMSLARRVPKKGFGNSEFRVSYEVVNVARLAGVAVNGEVTPDILKAAGLVKKSARYVKILGDGEVAAAVKVVAHHFSQGAREKIEKAGGSVTVLPGRHGKPAPASGGERHALASVKHLANLAKAAKASAGKKKAAAEADQAEKAEKAAKGPAAEKGERAPKGNRAPKGDGAEAKHEKHEKGEKHEPKHEKGEKHEKGPKSPKGDRKPE